MLYDPEKTDADLIIIGAGPAGLTAAQYGARANLRVLVLEQMAPGGQALLIDRLENYPGIAPGKTGFEFSEDLYRQAQEFGAKFLTEQVLSLGREGGLYAAATGKGKQTAPAAILATGAKHRSLDIPGEAAFCGRGVSYCATCDGPFFKNKRIFVVGGGDAACDEAQYLSRLSSQVILIHRRERFRAQRALAQGVLHNPNIEVRFNTVMKEIKGEHKVGSVILEKTSFEGKGTGELYEEAADAVFIFAGIIPQTSLVPDAEKDEAGYIVTDQHMASSLPGLFAAGDVRATPFRQVVVAAGEGAIAAHSAAAYIDGLKGESYQPLKL
jgi:thioredoxin reductase (NADPH)